MIGLWEALVNLATEIVKWIRSVGEGSGSRLLRTTRVYQEMIKILNETSIERTVVVLIHNGGKRLRVDTRKFGSAILEDYRTPLKSIFENYQDVPLDQHTITLISRVYTEGVVKFRPEDLNETSFLKSLYLSEGIKYVELHFLCDTKNDFTILSICTTNEIDNCNDPKSRMVIDNAVRKIKKEL